MLTTEAANPNHVQDSAWDSAEQSPDLLHWKRRRGGDGGGGGGWVGGGGQLRSEAVPPGKRKKSEDR